MSKFREWSSWGPVSLVLGAMALGACGGGDDDTPVVPTPTTEEPSLTEEKACELASAELRSEPREFPNGQEYSQFNIVECANYKSNVDEGEASIEIRAVKIYDPDTGGVTGEQTTREWFLCGLNEYDQGWVAELCIVRP